MNDPSFAIDDDCRNGPGRIALVGTFVEVDDMAFLS